jgi:hypothetical protein
VLTFCFLSFLAAFVTVGDGVGTGLGVGRGEAFP